MDKSTIYQRMQFQNEFESLVYQMMTRVKRGETIPDVAHYLRVRKMLQERSVAITNANAVQMLHESDWLALALYAEDRRMFAHLCLDAEANNDPVYRSASRWLGDIFEQTIEQYGAGA